MADQDSISLTESQVHQLHDFLDEKDHSGSVILRPAVNLGGSNIEVILLDAEGDPTSNKRILFPS